MTRRKTDKLGALPAQLGASGRAVCPGCASTNWSQSHRGVQLCRPCDILWDPQRIEAG